MNLDDANMIPMLMPNKLILCCHDGRFRAKQVRFMKEF